MENLVIQNIKRDIINPSNGETIARVCMASAKDTEYAIESARSAFDKGPWKDISLADRKNILLKISLRYFRKS